MARMLLMPSAPTHHRNGGSFGWHPFEDFAVLDDFKGVKLSFISARSVSVVTLTVLFPILAQAQGATRSSTQDFLARLPQFGSDSIDSFQQAYQSVRQSPLVSRLLRDSMTHSLSAASRTDGFGVTTTKFQHYYKGVEVMGSMSFHHATGNGAQVRNVISRFDLDTTPRLSADQAVAIAKSIVGDRKLGLAPELKILPVAGAGDAARLIYWVDVANEGLKAGYDILIDAHTGGLVASLSKMETIAPVQVVSAKDQGLKVVPIVEKNPVTGKYELTGCEVSDLSQGGAGDVLTVDQCKKVLRGETTLTDNQCQVVLMDSHASGDPLALDPGQCRQVVTNSAPVAGVDQAGKNALSNSTKVLDYYKRVHGRDSFDNRGSEVVSVVHAGIGYANAAWVQGMNFMLYGDGDGELMGDMTLGLDVAGHEMTHGVVSKTAKLVSMDESGALNEAYADFFGKMIAQDGSWVLGESLSLDKAKFPGIRNLENPGAFKSRYRDADGNKGEGPYPAKVSEQIRKKDATVCGADNDRCWVHYNSTIPGHASYKVFKAIGKQKAEALYYLTLTQYLTSDATFRKAAEATMSACAAKFDSATCTKVRAAFVEVGML